MTANQASNLAYPSPFRSSGSNSSYPPPPPLHSVVSGPVRGVNANGIIQQRQSPLPSPTQNRQFVTSSPTANPGQLPSPQFRGPGSVGSPPSSAYAQSQLSQLTPSMALRAASGGPVVEYNPQQWGAAGPTGGAYIPHSALASSVPRNPEDDPNPPPPYSPPHNRTTVATPESASSRPALPYLQTAIPQQSPDFATPISAIHVSPPQTAFERNRSNIRTVMASPMNQGTVPAISFPPPPGRDRSASRQRFGLSAIARGLSMDRSGANITPEPQMNTPSRSVDRNQGFVQAPRAANRMSVFAQPAEPMFIPPTSRRSASAGPMGGQTPINGTPSMNLPPPPPGPPPGGSRATSRQRDEHIEGQSTTVPIIKMPRHPRNNAPTLETVPATPAGWTEDGQPIQMTHTPSSSSDERSITPSPEQDRISRRARTDQEFRLERRDTTVKGIRERRSESRAAKDRMQDGTGSDDSKPVDLTLNLANSGITRQGAVKKSRASMSPQEVPTAGSSSRRGTLTNMSAPNSAKEKGPANRDSYDSQMSSNHVGNRHASRPPSFAGSIHQDAFAKGSLERHQQFIEKERLASTDRERLDLFAEFIVMESRLRRDRYATAFSAISGSDILDLTRDLWRPTQPPNSIGKAPARDASTGPRPLSNRTGSYDSQESGSSPLSSRANFTPRTEDSPSSAGIPPAREGTFKNFQPVLSPIPSMAMSSVVDDAPRGRSQSRWWESDDGSVGAIGGRRIERTARESKYMGLHPDARYNLQYDDEPSPAMASTPGRAGPSSEYPPEKVGWHEDEQQAPLATPQYSVPNTPSATRGLDVSRLVTLPPPYPRHYPANDMSHPELASIRSTIRTLSEMDVISEKKATFKARVTRQRAMASQEAAARIAQMRHNISEQVRLGQMSFASAAGAEDKYHAREAATKQAALRKEYEDFSPEVAVPLNALLSERVTKANACIASLGEGLNTANGNPDAPMEEGDEHPELLEKLKLIKWLADARESAYKEIFLLESERCERYCDFIIADIEGQNADGGPEAAKERAVEARQFFRKDQMQRLMTYEKDSRTRAEELLETIERHVSQGAQDQLSAFWDIAPGLVELLKKIPDDTSKLTKFRVSVPHSEIQENPSYSDHPLQYLYGLLCHAEKSTYQFIENQIGLWCLLQEISLMVIRSNLRVMKAERCAAEGRDPNDAELESEMAQLATFEEQRITSQLKDRVDTVEGQWNEGLGQVLQQCVESVEGVLRDAGGWEDGLRE